MRKAWHKAITSGRIWKSQGGVTLYTCPLCGFAISVRDRALHEGWHASVLGMGVEAGDGASRGGCSDGSRGRTMAARVRVKGSGGEAV